MWCCCFRVFLVLLDPLVLLDFRDSLVCLVLEEIVVPLVVLVQWYVETQQPTQNLISSSVKPMNMFKKL